MEFYIAIYKEDPNKWLDISARTPKDEEVMRGWKIYTVEAEDLQEAVGLAQKERMMEELNESNNET